MKERIAALRRQSLEAVNRISAERALLLTEFYASHTAESLSAPVRRALAFEYILKHKAICICDGEWIVGERGPQPKAVPTYPELCLHTLKDLETLHNRPKVSYRVEEDVRRAYEQEIIPYWQGKTVRERIFSEMSPEWIAAYEAGIFTEFLEQRAPGHTVLGHKIYSLGMTDLKRQAEECLARLDYDNDPEALDKSEELRAMSIAADALIFFAERHALELERMAEGHTDTERKQELLEMAALCRHVPAHAPQTFHQALQYYWFVHLGVITELNPWDSFNPGRLDQHLWPFYRQEREAGTLSEEHARELLMSFWIKFNNHPSPPKVGVTAEESSTYTDFALINIGGVQADGSDAANELSFLILDVVEEMRLLQPSSMVQISKKNPDRLLRRAVDIIKTGFGQPSLFNTDAMIEEMLRQGKAVEDARRGGASGCVEVGAFGTECYILTGYFNIPKVLEITLHNGIDPRSGRQIGVATGEISSFTTFEKLIEAFQRQLRHFLDIKIRGNNLIARMYAKYMPVPFLSLLIDDCIANGRDYNDGGARYNTTYIQGVGMGSITDSLAAIRYQVYDRKAIDLPALVDILDGNFQGQDALRAELLFHTPKYGNDDEYADQLARQVFEMYYRGVNDRPCSRGGVHRINLLPTTCHIYFGSVMGASPDGRQAGEPLSEGISPVQGADRKGPTAVLRSAAKLDHIRTGGALLNQKFTPQFLADEEGIRKLMSLVRTYFRLDGHHIQFNVVSAETLRQAQKHPEKHRDLIVRVAGYSDYFNDLGPALQNEIIRRTEHLGF